MTALTTPGCMSSSVRVKLMTDSWSGKLSQKIPAARNWRCFVLTGVKSIHPKSSKNSLSQQEYVMNALYPMWPKRWTEPLSRQRAQARWCEASNEFWAEALSTAVYIRNWCPAKAVDGMTLFEAGMKKKPSVSHLHFFGCKAYAHVLKDESLTPKPRNAFL